MASDSKDRRLKTFEHGFLGKCVIDTKEKFIYLFSKDNKSYMKMTFKAFDEIADRYKGVNTFYKPYSVICYEHQVKHNRHGLKPSDTNREEFMAYLETLDLTPCK